MLLSNLSYAELALAAVFLGVSCFLEYWRQTAVTTGGDGLLNIDILHVVHCDCCYSFNGFFALTLGWLRERASDL